MRSNGYCGSVDRDTPTHHGSPRNCVKVYKPILSLDHLGNGGSVDRDTPTHHGSLHNFLFHQRGGPLAFFNPFSASTNLDSPDTSLHDHDTSVDSQVRLRKHSVIGLFVYSFAHLFISH